MNDIISGLRRDAVSSQSTDPKQIVKRTIAGGVDLRICPLGDSITWGSVSTDGNGYRQNLQKLISPGNNLRFIGSLSSGTMNNNDNEGWRGYTIDNINGQTKNSLPERPNIVLVLAGTNDIIQVIDLVNAPTRLGNLIDQCLSDCPDATIIVGSITPLLDSTREANREAYNAAIPGVIATRANAGKHVLLADMSGIPASDITTVDGIHPLDAGFVIMANAWYAAINVAGSKGWINPPVSGAAIPAMHNGTGSAGGATSSGGVCSALPNWKPPVTIAFGVGATDGPFVQKYLFRKSVVLECLKSRRTSFLLEVADSRRIGYHRVRSPVGS